MGAKKFVWWQWVFVIVVTGCGAGERLRADTSKTSPPVSSGQSYVLEGSNYSGAAEYSRRNGGLSMLVMKNGKIVFEDYTENPSKAYKLASGTKSFWGVAAIAASEDGLLDLDERVADTITEWRNDPRRSKITVRELLNFTSGLDPGVKELRGQARSKDYFQIALDMPLVANPGTSFTYGATHLTVFGELLKRKLAARGKTSDPVAYLEERILNPINLRISDWTRDGKGNPLMAAGAVVTAREWAKFGEFVNRNGIWNGNRIVKSNLLDKVTVGSQANPAYGLTFWLNKEAAGALSTSASELAGPAKKDGAASSIFPEGPSDLFMAAGARQQRMYIIPSLDTIIVRQGGKGGRAWSDAAFLQLALGIPGEASTTAPAAAEGGGGARGAQAACRADAERLCRAGSNMKRLRRCLRRHKNELSPECAAAMGM